MILEGYKISGFDVEYLKRSLEKSVEKIKHSEKNAELNYAVYEFPFNYLKIGYKNSVLTMLKKVDKTNDYGRKTEFI